MNSANSLTLKEFEDELPYYNVSNYPYTPKTAWKNNICASELRKNLYFIFENGMFKMYSEGD